MLVEVFPERSPAGGGQEQGAQGEDALGSFTGPLHNALAEPRFDKGFAGGFGHAAAEYNQGNEQDHTSPQFRLKSR